MRKVRHAHPSAIGPAPVSVELDHWDGSAPHPPVPRWLLAGSFIVLCVAVGLRIWRLGNVPGVNGDEAWYGVLAWRIATGSAFAWWTPTGNPLNPFYVGPLVLLHLAAEPSVTLLRTVAVVSGSLALGMNYWLCRKVYGSRTAAISSLILAVLPINIAYSRFGWDASQSLAASLPVLYLSTVAGREGRAWGTLAAAVGALAVAVLVHPTNVFLSPLVIIAGVRVSTRTELASRLRLLPRPARAGLGAVLAFSGASLAWLVSSWHLVSLDRLVDVDRMLEFLNRFQRLFTGVTVYQFISGALVGTGSQQSRGLSPVLYDVAGLAILGTAVAFLASRNRSKVSDLDSMLLRGWVASAAVFYLVAGPQALAPHWERYAIWLVAPTTLVVARAAAHWTHAARGSHARHTLLLVAGAFLLASFYWNYFHMFSTTGGRSHQTFWTGPAEPKAEAVAHIARHRDDGASWLVTSSWWTYWPLTYLVGGEQGLRVLWADMAWSKPDVLASAGSGRVWVVEFAGSKEAAAGRASLESATLSSSGEPGIPPLIETFTFDYAGRAVLSIVRTQPRTQ